MPDISDEDLLQYQRAVELIKQLGTNPDSQDHFARALKVFDPKIKTRDEQTAELAKPYVERMDALAEELKAMREERETERKSREEADALARLDAGFERLRKAGVTDEGIDKVKALMQEHTIPHPEAAFALYERQNPPPPPEQAGYRPERWDYEGDLMPDAKDWFLDPEGSEDRAIAQILADERKSRSE